MKISTLSIALGFLIFFQDLSAFGQDADSTKDRNLRIELEPATFVLRGVAGDVMYNITKNNLFMGGLYFATMDIPNWAKRDVFVGGVTDSTDVRLGFEAAIMLRHKFKLFKQWESNPYLGLITGWEFFNVKQPWDSSAFRLSTFLFTPILGYEIFLLKKMLYINPQIRGAMYFGGKSSDPTRTEKVDQFLLLPQISLGIRL